MNSGQVRRLRWLVIALLIIGCFSIWLLSGSPAITLPILKEVLSPSYIFLLSKNTSEAASGPSYGQTQPQQQLTQQVTAYILKELPPDDETTLIDIKNFHFTINHDPCNKNQPFLLMLIHSAPENVRKRKVIRETWGRPAPEIVCLFMIGSSDRYQSQILEEDSKFKDIIQGNFVDVYRNLTYKHVMVLKWVTYHCSSAKYILKTDDDVFVNIPAVIDYLKREVSSRKFRRLIMCYVNKNMTPLRLKSKWQVSLLEYPGSKYPTYCGGWVILYLPDSVFFLYRQAQKEPYFWIDDVHVTGTVAQRANVTHASFPSWRLTRKSMRDLLVDSTKRIKFLFGPLNAAEREIRILQSLVDSGVA